MEEELEMPTPCQNCGKWFDLNDGLGSEKWFPNTIICEQCSEAESKEISRDNEIQECIEQIDDAVETIKDARTRLEEAQYAVPTVIFTPFY